MTPTDEQRITTSYAINSTKKTVVAQFSQPVHNLQMAPTEAAQMAKILLTCARELAPQAVEGFTWPEMDKRPELSPIHEGPAAGKAS